MRVELTDTSLVDDLVAFLRNLGCDARRVDDEAEVHFEWQETEAHGFSPPNQAEAELVFLVRVWVREHSGVAFRVADDSGRWREG